MALELTTPSPPSLEELERTLAAELAVERSGTSEGELIYYDTFDALLHEAGLLLVHEHGRLSLRDRETLAEREGESLAVASDSPLRGQELPPGALRDALLQVIEVRALLPTARVRERVQSLRVLDGLQKTVARVSLVVPELVSSSGLRTPLSVRIRVSGVRGYDEELERTQRLLAAGLTASPAASSLLDEAIVAGGGSPAGRSAKVDVQLDAEERTDQAAVRILTRLLEVMDDNLPGVIADTDPEFLHDYRVAVRRTRSVQRELRQAFAPAELARLRGEFKWLQAATGPSRDLDVYVLGFGELRALLPEQLQPDLDPLLGVLEGRRLLAHRAMVADLRSARADALRRDWDTLLAALADLPVADRPAATTPIGEVSAQRTAKVYRRMVKLGREIDASSPPEDYHELRKKGKELRYLLELFGAPLHDEAVVKPMIRALKGLQDVLGRHQDREVQVTMLRSLADEVFALPDGARTLLAMGALVAALEEDAARARSEFAERFAEFASKEQRRLVRETFV